MYIVVQRRHKIGIWYKLIEVILHFIKSMLYKSLTIPHPDREVAAMSIVL